MHDLLFQNQPLFDRGSLRGYAANLGLDVEQFDGCLSSEQYRDECWAITTTAYSYASPFTPTFSSNGRRLVAQSPSPSSRAPSRGASLVGAPAASRRLKTLNVPTHLGGVMLLAPY